MSRGPCALLTILLGFGLAACGGQDTGPTVTAPVDDVAAASEAGDPSTSPEPAEPEILVLPGAPEEAEDETE